MVDYKKLSLTDRVRAILAGGAAVDIGQMEFINLDEVRVECGENWGHWRERIFIAAEAIINKHASTKDLVVRCGSGFIIIFGDKEPQEVEAIGEIIARQVRKFFLGAPEFAHLGLKMETARLSANEFAERLSKAEPDKFGTSNHAHPDDRIQKPGAAAPASVQTGKVPKISIEFRPVWSARAEAVGTFFCLPSRKTRDGTVRYGAAILPADARPKDLLTLDVHVVRRAREALRSLGEYGLRSAIGLAVNYSVVSHARTRVKLLQELAPLGDRFRSQVLLRLDGVPADVPASQISEISRLCRPYCGQLILDLPLETYGFDRYADAHVNVVGLRLPRSEARPFDYRDAIERHVNDARRRQRVVYLAGCHSPEVIREAAVLGLGYFSGQAIGAPLDMPTAPYRLSWDEIGRVPTTASQAGRKAIRG